MTDRIRLTNPTLDDVAHLKAGDEVTVRTTTACCGDERVATTLSVPLVAWGGDGGLYVAGHGYLPYLVDEVRLDPGAWLEIPAPPAAEPEPVCPWPGAVVEAVARKLAMTCDWNNIAEQYRDAYRDDARRALAAVPYTVDPFPSVDTARLEQIAHDPQTMTISEAMSLAQKRAAITVKHRRKMGVE